MILQFHDSSLKGIIVTMSCSSKRTFIISNCSQVNFNNSHVPHKKKKKLYKRGTTFVPPTKFLLGGNIRDPLNLNGLQEDDDSVREEGVTDVVLPASTDFLLGGNIFDPLNLKGISEQDVEKPILLESEEVHQNDKTEEKEMIKKVVEEAKQHDPCIINTPNVVDLVINFSDIRHRKLDRKDKIVSPVIPQPYRPLKTIPFRQIITPDLATKTQHSPKFKEKNTRFQYGNYRKYYGIRNLDNGVDLRLEILERHRELFLNKDVLDIGCNIGHVSLIIARSFGARSVTGVDIDRSLIDVANKNIQYYVNCPSPYSMESPSASSTACIKRVNLKYKCYPVSMPILYGPIHEHNDLCKESNQMFPKNVRFQHGNYVLEAESLLEHEQALYDTILCLSVTKWIHLNWGDDGLQLAFKRMYSQLRPGGVLILEPQSWGSYKRKKNLTEPIWKNYQNIHLFPHHFDRYLLSSEVGFSRCQALSVVNHQHKGFRRVIKVFRKPLRGVNHPLSKCWSKEND